MKVLAEDDLRRLSSSLNSLYSAVLQHIVTYVRADDIPSSSGFRAMLDYCTAGPEFYYVDFEFCWRKEELLDLRGSFSTCPMELIIFATGGVRPLRWELILMEDVPDHRWASEVLAVFDDWLTGELCLVSHLRTGVAYRRELMRHGEVVASERSWIYPYWGKESTVVQRCSFKRLTEATA